MKRLFVVGIVLSMVVVVVLVSLPISTFEGCQTVIVLNPLILYQEVTTTAFKSDT